MQLAGRDSDDSLLSQDLAVGGSTPLNPAPGSVEQAAAFLAEQVQHARFGNEHGIGAHTQFARHLVYWSSFQRDPLECGPTLGFEAWPDHLQEPAGNMGVVLFIPKPAQTAFRIFELLKDVAKVTGPARLEALC